ncbi:sortase [Candidatus Collierbacteria bacterium]|nr:sortase [Candidatus Collierbacteria bacterium]
MQKLIYKKAPIGRAVSSKKLSQTISIVMVISGAMMVGAVIGPIIGYFAIISPQLNSGRNMLSALPSTTNSQILGSNNFTPAVYRQLDYTKPENWFPEAGYPSQNISKITSYNISVPKIRIDNMTVIIGGTDLSKSLIQYPGTANPGELGAPVIFGHSILRQFYNPKNYMSIFSTIMTLEYGDEIKIKFDGINYVYKVVDKIEVKPEDVQILEQKYNGRYLKLVTCVPEGTYLRRGVVIAELVN